VLLLS